MSGYDVTNEGGLYDFFKMALENLADDDVSKVEMVASNYRSRAVMHKRELLFKLLMYEYHSPPSHPTLSALFRRWLDEYGYPQLPSPDQSCFANWKKRWNIGVRRLVPNPETGRKMIGTKEDG